jgi:cytochrome c biogenesis protein CcmG/thiol:disulfide interchange protein DsbE
MRLTRRHAVMLVPLAVAGGIGVAFKAMLDGLRTGQFDPHALNNPLVGQKLPDFAVSPIGPGKGFTSADLLKAAAEKPVLVNFFASYCIPCAEEADVLGGLAAEGLPVWGIAWKDHEAPAVAFFNRYGNPFARLGNDTTGRVVIDWGVYGVPESFLIDRNGIVRWHYAGGLSDDLVHDELRPALRAIA